MSLYISIPGKEEFGEVCLLLFTVIASCLLSANVSVLSKLSFSLKMMA